MTDAGFSKLEAKLYQAQIPALDGLRMLAVLMVIGYHFLSYSLPGHLGVLSFFVLSGFLITWLLLKEQERRGSISVRDFYRRRILRIFPAYYCFFLIYLITIKMNGRPMATGSAVSAFFYVSDYYYVFPVPLRGLIHTWSLSIEEQFYLIWPWVVVWAAGDLKRMARFLAAGVLLVQLWRPFLLYVLHAPERYLDSAFDAQCDSLLIGCLLAVLLKMRAGGPQWARISQSSFAPLLPIGVLIGSAYLNVRSHSLGLSIGYAIDAYAVTVLLVQLIALSDRPLWSWLNGSVVRYFGRISYPMYLYHFLTMSLGISLMAQHAVRYQLAAGFAFTIAGASLSYFVVEMPFLRRKDRRPANATTLSAPPVATLIALPDTK